MFLLYNGQLLPENELRLPLSNRAFQYNDGFFETIMVAQGKVRFWAAHWERIQEAAQVLQIALPLDLTAENLARQILFLAQENQCGYLARVKLKIWRSGEGLYTPPTDAADWLLTAQPAPLSAASALQVGLCQTVRTVPSPFSSFKGINAPVYILASREKTHKGYDDLLLLDPHGNLSELTFSNLFWVKENTLFTPALATGCLNGVLRRSLLAWALKNQWQTQEGLFPMEDLLKAELVFAGNVTGLRAIASLEHQALPQAEEHLAKLEKVFLG
ncbi:aminotransferase class IV [Rufibacter ruber]|uniref:aminotransferase class IV n=1 Tax=Rufibacter ruber TaxID=1783499 RepID=UPI00083611DA|nr:aminotransferase class IV [Rufibacter ruber]